MTLSKKHLTAKLSDCKISDRFRFKRRIDRLTENDQSEAMNQLAEEVQRSCEWVQERKNRATEIDYPDLPISSRREEIAAAIKDNQVVILAGETGSGKTTQLPKICLDLGLGCKGLIGHTQPRRLAARTVADRIAEELKTTLGDRVGYQVRFHDQVSEASQIKLMTDGVLLAETVHDRFLEKYEVIIIDEAHERSLNIDFLLGYIKNILPKRPNLKLIITSATIDLERFSKHFNNAPVIEVSGRTYPVELLYRPLNELTEDDNKTADINSGVLSAVAEILDKGRGSTTRYNDILIFFSGEREIREAAEALRKAELKHVDILPLYARLSVSEQQKIFTLGRTTKRRIVLSTNVAETSVTVPGIGYVIDTGVARISRYSYRSKVQRLPIESISQASANQRAGRCGRLGPGTCIRLYSEEDFNGRVTFTDAEIRRTNLAAVILQMLNLKLGDISAFPFIDPPDSRFINDGFKLLEELGAVTRQKKMTTLGRQLGKLPVDPRIGRMVIEAHKQNALSEVLIIASALSVQEPRERPLDKQQAADLCHREYIDPDSDFVSFINLWRHYEEQRQNLSSNQLRKYCSKHFLSFMRMREWRDVHRQLHLACKSLNYKENSQNADYQSVHVSLLAGLLSHIGFKQENKEFLGARNRKFFVFPASTQYKKPAKWIMASELVETSKLYGRNIAKIEPEWVEPLAKHLIKKSYLEPKWQKKRAQVTAYEQVMLYGLILVNKRTVNFGAIEPETSQEIFIRSALVEGHYFSKAKFFSHNQQLLAGVEHLEAKSRRKDLLVDEETLYQFYADKIAENSKKAIVSGAGFEQWRKQAEEKDPEYLFLREQDILQRSSDHIQELDYPNSLQWKGVDLTLEYHFDPLAIDDGVSIRLPITLLKQFPKQRLDWVVPGLLKDRCIALLKALPKQRRKHFVPIPDYINAFIEGVSFAEGELLPVLCHHLLRMTGVKLDPSEFAEATVASHLMFNIKLIDSNNVQIDQGRDIVALRDKYSTLVETELNVIEEEVWGEKGLTCWSFSELKECIETKQGGITVTAWPALKKNGEVVDLVLTMNQGFSNHLSILGMTQLGLLMMNSLVKKHKGKIPKINESTLFIGKKFTKKMLENEICSFAMRRSLGLDQELPRTEAAFMQRIKKVQTTNVYVENLQEIAEQVYLLHKRYHQLQKQLQGTQSLQTITIISDIKQQLESLFEKDYLSYISWYRLQQYTRYMNGLEVRLEKFQRELPRQRLLSEQLKEIIDRLNNKIKQTSQRDEWYKELDDYRWLIEEYRISLFAQQLGTVEIVSEKRMKQKWQALEI